MLIVEVLNEGKPVGPAAILIAKQTLYMRVPWFHGVAAFCGLSPDLVSCPRGLVVSHSMGVDIVARSSTIYRSSIWEGLLSHGNFQVGINSGNANAVGILSTLSMARPGWLGSDPCRSHVSMPAAVSEDAEYKFEDVADSPVAGKRALSVGGADSVDTDALAKFALDAIASLEKLLVALGFEEDDAGSVVEGVADAGFSDDDPVSPHA